MDKMLSNRFISQLFRYRRSITAKSRNMQDYQKVSKSKKWVIGRLAWTFLYIICGKPFEDISNERPVKCISICNGGIQR